MLTRKLYKLAGMLAAVALLSIAVLILAQIGARMLGYQIKSADDFAGWMLAASLFLALPMTLQAGDHIRVTALSEMLPAGAQRVLDLVATTISVVVILWATWKVLAYVRESWVYGDMSQGIIAVPLWIPQIAMAVGMVLFALALGERLLRGCVGRPVAGDDRIAQGHGE